jgi:hypothetical protein
MSSIDRLYDYRPPMTRAGLAAGTVEYNTALANEHVAVATSGSAAIADTLLMADGNTWDGTGAYPDLRGNWVVLEAQGADCYFRTRPDNVSSMAHSYEGDVLPAGEQVRYLLTTASRYIEVLTTSGTGYLKKRFSNKPVM